MMENDDDDDVSIKLYSIFLLIIKSFLSGGMSILLIIKSFLSGGMSILLIIKTLLTD
jgi:hypothetical protein